MRWKNYQVSWGAVQWQPSSLVHFRPWAHSLARENKLWWGTSPSGSVCDKKSQVQGRGFDPKHKNK